VPKRHAPVKILIVDDHPLVREGLALRISLHSDLGVCGEADNEEQAMELVRQMQPDLVLVDISLKSGHGLELIKRIHSLAPTVKVLVISGFEESLYAERALRAGALGYLNKQESNERMIEAIRTVLAGHRFVTPAMSRRLVEQALGTSVNHRTPIEQLTNRELEIFHMIGQGIKTSDIAERLFLSTHTIDTHRENIKRKLTISSAAELTRAAVQWVLELG
jgi:DNA-binding NarL/FixJ family response regulator